MKDEDPRHRGLAQAGLIAAMLLAAVLVVFSLQPDAVRAWGQTGEIACGLLACLGTCRGLLHADPAWVRRSIGIALALVVATFIAGAAHRVAVMVTARSMPELLPAALDGWVRLLLDLACTVSIGALCGAVAARSMQGRHQP